MNWRNTAACQGGDPELFFPVSGSRPMSAQVQDAKRVCADCPVQPACLEWALATGVDHGVWGGLTEEERRALRRPRLKRRVVRHRRLAS